KEYNKISILRKKACIYNLLKCLIISKNSKVSNKDKIGDSSACVVQECKTCFAGVTILRKSSTMTLLDDPKTKLG
ncbi:MAG: hypothetical protein VSS52_006060, partial [Thiotrichaceae bacterium]|nr:hypothetical protein [Thiotrichaceae bacterium]